MQTRIELQMLAQPDDTTCGPTCLHAIYRYYDDPIDLEAVIREVPRLEHGGTLAVLLANHALARGYEATIYTYNLDLLDPTWFRPGVDIAERLRMQMRHKTLPRLEVATRAYLEFLERGGVLRFEDLTRKLLRRFLFRSKPVLAGLSATFLYHEAREIHATNAPDDVRGEPAGHFVVLCGYDKARRKFDVADPLSGNPYSRTHHYEVDVDRLVGAILLGSFTYDAALLVLEPGRAGEPA